MLVVPNVVKQHVRAGGGGERGGGRGSGKDIHTALQGQRTLSVALAQLLSALS
jgi:hypothetical protein